MLYDETLAAIVPPDETAMEAAWKRWDSIAKPLRSLGKLEEMGCPSCRNLPDRSRQLGEESPDSYVRGQRRSREGVTQTGQEVTAIVAENFPA